MEQKLKGQTASIVEFIFGGLIILGAFGSIAINPLQSIAYILFGAFLVVTGVQWRLLIKDYRTYMTILSNDPSGSLASISQATNASTTAVKDNLKLMIKKGLAKDIAIDEQAGRVLRNVSQENIAATPVTNETHLETVAVVCNGCGAKNEVLKGSVSKCEHCGTTIQA